MVIRAWVSVVLLLLWWWKVMPIGHTVLTTLIPILKELPTNNAGQTPNHSPKSTRRQSPRTGERRPPTNRPGARGSKNARHPQRLAAAVASIVHALLVIATLLHALPAKLMAESLALGLAERALPPVLHDVEHGFAAFVRAVFAL